MKYRILFTLALCAGLVRPGTAAVRASGYASADYLKGQSRSEFSPGTFTNLRAGGYLSGEFASKFQFVLEGRTTDGRTFDLVQAWAGLAVSDALQVRAGLFLVPFGAYNDASRAFETRLVAPPFPISEIYPDIWRDIGLRVEGKFGFLRYAAFLGNGLSEAETFKSGQQFGDNNSDKGRGGRIGLILGEGFEIGGSYYTGKVDADNGRSLVLSGLDAAWSSESIHLTAEYVKAEVENPAPFNRGTAEGYFVLCSFDVGSVSPHVAFEKYRADDPFHGSGFAGPLVPGLGLSDDRRTWAIGLVATLAPGLYLKAEYDLNKVNGSTDGTNVLRAQIAFHI
jgi:hypothetical protein